CPWCLTCRPIGPVRPAPRSTAASCRGVWTPRWPGGSRRLRHRRGARPPSRRVPPVVCVWGAPPRSGQFSVAPPSAARRRPGFEGVVGYFINLLPLRADLSGNPSFRALLGRVAATVLDALAHQDYPFPLLVERLKVERDLSRAPLVQVSFTLEKAHRAQDL